MCYLHFKTEPEILLKIILILKTNLSSKEPIFLVFFFFFFFFCCSLLKIFWLNFFNLGKHTYTHFTWIVFSIDQVLYTEFIINLERYEKGIKWKGLASLRWHASWNEKENPILLLIKRKVYAKTFHNKNKLLQKVIIGYNANIKLNFSNFTLFLPG